MTQNIIFLVLDTVRADHLSSYGYRRETSPTLDSLADNGIQYMSAFSNSIWTPTSHATMFTGRLPSQTGVYGGESKLPESETTLPEAVNRLGYNTFLASAGIFIRAENGYDRGVNVYHSGDDYRPRPTPELLLKLIRDRPIRKQFVADLTTTSAKNTTLKIAALKEFISDTSTPFFAFLNTKAAHHPYCPPRPYHEEYVPEHQRTSYEILSFLYRKAGDPHGGDSIEGVNEDRINDLDTQYPITANIFEPSENEMDVIQGWYDGAIRYIDDKISELIAHLKKEKVYENTTLIITSDHGELFGEHGLEKHYYRVYDQLLHVPLIIHPADGTESTIDNIVSLVDLYPTILELAGADNPGVDLEWANSLVPFAERPEHEYLVAETGHKSDRPITKHYPEFDDSEYDKALHSVRTEEFKYITDRKGHEDLYKWRDDPGNFSEISDKYKEVCHELRSLVEERLEPLSGKQWADDPDAVTSNNHLRQQLEDLGYL